MSNPFNKSLDKFRGKRVRARSDDGSVYEGWVERIHHQDNHFVLQGAEFIEPVIDPGGNRVDDPFIAPGNRTHVGRVFVKNAGPVELAHGGARVEEIDLDAIENAPYAIAEFTRDGNEQYIDEVRRYGWVRSFPVVRRIAPDSDEYEDATRSERATENISMEVSEDGELEGEEQNWPPKYEIVEGHKRLWVARQAGLTDHPVEVIHCSDADAARRFAYDHFPTDHQLDYEGKRSNGWYSDDDLRESIPKVIAAAGEEAAEYYPLTFNVARLTMTEPEMSIEGANERDVLAVEAAADEHRSLIDGDP